MKPPATFVIRCFCVLFRLTRFRCGGCCRVCVVVGAWAGGGFAVVCVLRCALSFGGRRRFGICICVHLSPTPGSQACAHRVAVERPGVQGRQQVGHQLALAVAAVERHRDGGLDKKRVEPRLRELGEAVLLLLFALVRLCLGGCLGRRFGRF